MSENRTSNPSESIMAPQIERQRDFDHELVSCIMPTYNRREWIGRGIECFLAQDYSNRELVVMDDGSDAVSDLIPVDRRVRYERLHHRLSIGVKRNLACELARGNLIAHWDDDDWYPCWRLSRQVSALSTSDADICGTSELYYLDGAGRRAFRYAYADKTVWVAGNTLLFKKCFWKEHPFPDLQVGEDSRFVWSASAQKILDLKDTTICIASIHSHNTSPKVVAGRWWHPVQFAEVQGMIDRLNYSAPVTNKEASRPNTGDCMQPIHDHSTVHCGYRIAREADLRFAEFAAFHQGQSLPHMRRWEMPWTLFAAQLGNTMSVLDCTINPVRFGERIARLFPNVQYRHVSPVPDGLFRLPFGVPDESFDRVFCVNTLEHLVHQQREALVADLARKLKPGGLLVLTSDYYFDSSWSDPAFLNAGVMRSDRTEFFNGWNKISAQDWLALCHAHGLVPIDPGPWDDPRGDDPTLFRNLSPFSHATIAGVFSRGPRCETARRRILLALLTWNTCEISVESVKAYLREARMLRRLGCEPYICICDNGSHDGTQQALRSLETQIDLPYRLILNPQNIGNSRARNQIIECMFETGADYLLFMDGDIELVPFSSFAMMRHMENCGYRLGCIGADSNGQTPWPDRASKNLFSIEGMKIEEVNLVAWTQYGMFRRSVFEQGVRFDESGPFAGPGWGFEDNDLAFQMDLQGFRNQRYFGMIYLHRAARSSVRIMRQLGLDPNALYAQRKQYVIDKWASTPHINNGPLALVRRVEMHL